MTVTPLTPTVAQPEAALAFEEMGLFAPTYPLPRLALARGKGTRVWDVTGREYLDFASGIAVNAFGHAPRGLRKAVSEQMRSLVHVSNLFSNGPAVDLALHLARATGYPQVFFCNSGTEANEAALKFARVVAAARGRAGRAIVAFQGGFHGRTALSLSATHTPAYREPFAPLVPGVRFAPFNDVAALDAVLDDEVCAIIAEPVQGESGAVPATREFLTALRARANALNALLVFDEVQSGMGRCGHLLAAEHFGVKADLTTLSKALGGGLPLGAVLMSAEVAKALAPGLHGCTFGGGPVVTAAGAWTLKQVDSPGFLAKVRGRAARLERGLAALVEGHRSLALARGLGLLRAVDLDPAAGFGAPQLVAAAREQGLLLVRGGESAVRLLPPLTVTNDEIAEALGALDRALTALESAATKGDAK